MFLVRNAFIGSGLLDRQEVAVLAGVEVRVVDKAVEQGVLSLVQGDEGSAFPLEAVRAIALLRDVELPLPVPTKRHIVGWVSALPQSDDGSTTLLSQGLAVRYSPGAAEADARARRYVNLRDRWVASDPEVRGGEPVVRGTRVPLRGLARQIEQGEPPQALREDYAHIAEEVFEMAPIWAKAHPRRGRPRRPWQEQ